MNTEAQEATLTVNLVDRILDGLLIDNYQDLKAEDYENISAFCYKHSLDQKISNNIQELKNRISDVASESYETPNHYLDDILNIIDSNSSKNILDEKDNISDIHENDQIVVLNYIFNLAKKGSHIISNILNDLTLLIQSDDTFKIVSEIYNLYIVKNHKQLPIEVLENLVDLANSDDRYPTIIAKILKENVKIKGLLNNNIINYLEESLLKPDLKEISFKTLLKYFKINNITPSKTFLEKSLKNQIHHKKFLLNLYWKNYRNVSKAEKNFFIQEITNIFNNYSKENFLSSQEEDLVNYSIDQANNLLNKYYIKLFQNDYDKNFIDNEILILKLYDSLNELLNKYIKSGYKNTKLINFIYSIKAKYLDFYQEHQEEISSIENNEIKFGSKESVQNLQEYIPKICFYVKIENLYENAKNSILRIINEDSTLIIPELLENVITSISKYNGESYQEDIENIIKHYSDAKDDNILKLFDIDNILDFVIPFAPLCINEDLFKKKYLFKISYKYGEIYMNPLIPIHTRLLSIDAHNAMLGWVYINKNGYKTYSKLIDENSLLSEEDTDLHKISFAVADLLCQNSLLFSDSVITPSKIFSMICTFIKVPQLYSRAKIWIINIIDTKDESFSPALLENVITSISKYNGESYQEDINNIIKHYINTKDDNILKLLDIDNILDFVIPLALESINDDLLKKEYHLMVSNKLEKVYENPLIPIHTRLLSIKALKAMLKWVYICENEYKNYSKLIDENSLLSEEDTDLHKISFAVANLLCQNSYQNADFVKTPKEFFPNICTFIKVPELYSRAKDWIINIIETHDEKFPIDLFENVITTISKYNGATYQDDINNIIKHYIEAKDDNILKLLDEDNILDFVIPLALESINDDLLKKEYHLMVSKKLEKIYENPLIPIHTRLLSIKALKAMLKWVYICENEYKNYSKLIDENSLLSEEDTDLHKISFAVADLLCQNSYQNDDDFKTPQEFFPNICSFIKVPELYSRAKNWIISIIETHDEKFPIDLFENVINSISKYDGTDYKADINILIEKYARQDRNNILKLLDRENILDFVMPLVPESINEDLLNENFEEIVASKLINIFENDNYPIQTRYLSVKSLKGCLRRTRISEYGQEYLCSFIDEESILSSNDTEQKKLSIEVFEFLYLNHKKFKTSNDIGFTTTASIIFPKICSFINVEKLYSQSIEWIISILETKHTSFSIGLLANVITSISKYNGESYQDDINNIIKHYINAKDDNILKLLNIDNILDFVIPLVPESINDDLAKTRYPLRVSNKLGEIYENSQKPIHTRLLSIKAYKAMLKWVYICKNGYKTYSKLINENSLLSEEDTDLHKISLAVADLLCQNSYPNHYFLETPKEFFPNICTFIKVPQLYSRAKNWIINIIRIHDEKFPIDLFENVITSISKYNGESYQDDINNIIKHYINAKDDNILKLLDIDNILDFVIPLTPESINDYLFKKRYASKVSNKLGEINKNPLIPIHTRLLSIKAQKAMFQWVHIKEYGYMSYSVLINENSLLSEEDTDLYKISFAVADLLCQNSYQNADFVKTPKEFFPNICTFIKVPQLYSRAKNWIISIIDTKDESFSPALLENVINSISKYNGATYQEDIDNIIKHYINAKDDNILKLLNIDNILDFVIPLAPESINDDLAKKGYASKVSNKLEKIYKNSQKPTYTRLLTIKADKAMLKWVYINKYGYKNYSKLIDEISLLSEEDTDLYKISFAVADLLCQNSYQNADFLETSQEFFPNICTFIKVPELYSRAKNWIISIIDTKDESFSPALLGNVINSISKYNGASYQEDINNIIKHYINAKDDNILKLLNIDNILDFVIPLAPESINYDLAEKGYDFKVSNKLFKIHNNSQKPTHTRLLSIKAHKAMLEWVVIFENEYKNYSKLIDENSLLSEEDTDLHKISLAVADLLCQNSYQNADFVETPKEFFPNICTFIKVPELYSRAKNWIINIIETHDEKFPIDLFENVITTISKYYGATYQDDINNIIKHYIEAKDDNILKLLDEDNILDFVIPLALESINDDLLKKEYHLMVSNKLEKVYENPLIPIHTRLLSIKALKAMLKWVYINGNGYKNNSKLIDENSLLSEEDTDLYKISFAVADLLCQNSYQNADFVKTPKEFFPNICSFIKVPELYSRAKNWIISIIETHDEKFPIDLFENIINSLIKYNSNEYDKDIFKLVINYAKYGNHISTKILNICTEKSRSSTNYQLEFLVLISEIDKKSILEIPEDILNYIENIFLNPRYNEELRKKSKEVICYIYSQYNSKDCAFPKIISSKITSYDLTFDIIEIFEKLISGSSFNVSHNLINDLFDAYNNDTLGGDSKLRIGKILHTSFNIAKSLPLKIFERVLDGINKNAGDNFSDSSFASKIFCIEIALNDVEILNIQQGDHIKLYQNSVYLLEIIKNLHKADNKIDTQKILEALNPEDNNKTINLKVLTLIYNILIKFNNKISFPIPQKGLFNLDNPDEIITSFKIIEELSNLNNKSISEYCSESELDILFNYYNDKITEKILKSAKYNDKNIINLLTNNSRYLNSEIFVKFYFSYTKSYWGQDAYIPLKILKIINTNNNKAIQEEAIRLVKSLVDKNYHNESTFIESKDIKAAPLIQNDDKYSRLKSYKITHQFYSYIYNLHEISERLILSNDKKFNNDVTKDLDFIDEYLELDAFKDVYQSIFSKTFTGINGVFTDADLFPEFILEKLMDLIPLADDNISTKIIQIIQKISDKFKTQSNNLENIYDSKFDKITQNNFISIKILKEKLTIFSNKTNIDNARLSIIIFSLVKNNFIDCNNFFKDVLRSEDPDYKFKSLLVLLTKEIIEFLISNNIDDSFHLLLDNTIDFIKKYNQYSSSSYIVINTYIEFIKDNEVKDSKNCQLLLLDALLYLYIKCNKKPSDLEGEFLIDIIKKDVQEDIVENVINIINNVPLIKDTKAFHTLKSLQDITNSIEASNNIDADEVNDLCKMIIELPILENKIVCKLISLLFKFDIAYKNKFLKAISNRDNFYIAGANLQDFLINIYDYVNDKDSAEYYVNIFQKSLTNLNEETDTPIFEKVIILRHYHDYLYGNTLDCLKKFSAGKKTSDSTSFYIRSLKFIHQFNIKDFILYDIDFLITRTGNNSNDLEVLKNLLLIHLETSDEETEELCYKDSTVNLCIKYISKWELHNKIDPSFVRMLIFSCILGNNVSSDSYEEILQASCSIASQKVKIAFYELVLWLYINENTDTIFEKEKFYNLIDQISQDSHNQYESIENIQDKILFLRYILIIYKSDNLDGSLPKICQNDRFLLHPVISNLENCSEQQIIYIKTNINKLSNAWELNYEAIAFEILLQHISLNTESADEFIKIISMARKIEFYEFIRIIIDVENFKYVLAEKWLSKTLFISNEQYDLICFKKAAKFLFLLNWDLELIDWFLSNLRYETEIKDIYKLLELTVEFEITSGWLINYCKDVNIGINALSAKDYIKNIIKEESKLYIHYIVKSDAFPKTSQLAIDFLSLVDIGWEVIDVMKFYRFIDRIYYSRCISMNSYLNEYDLDISNIFKIIIDYKITPKDKNSNGENINNFIFFYKKHELCNKLYQLGIYKHFGKKTTTKTNDQLFQELKERNTHNEQLYNLLQGNYYRSKLEKIEEKLNTYSNILSEGEIKNWKKKNILDWVKKVKKLKKLEIEILNGTSYTRQEIEKKKKEIKSLVKPLNEIDFETTIYSKSEDFKSEIIAVIKRACYLENGYYPRDVQIIALINSVELGQDKGIINQVSTGEGKTLIVAMTAIYLTINGHIVDVITSSSILACRDSEDKKGLYNIFGYKASSIEKKPIFEMTEENCYKDEIIYGSIDQYQFHLLIEIHGKVIHRGNRKYDIAIVDEVDSMLVDSGSKVARIASNLPGMEYLSYVMASIWYNLNFLDEHFCNHNGKLLWIGHNFTYENNEIHLKQVDEIDPQEVEIIEVHCKDSFLKDRLRDLITSLIDEKTEEIVYIPEHLKDLVKSRIKAWSESAILAKYSYRENINYVISGNSTDKRISPVDYSNTGVVQTNTTWDNGLHQFLELKHKLKIRPENTIISYLSNVGYLKKYSNIKGLTGTIGGKDTHSLLKHVYNVDIAFIPTFKTKYFIELPYISCDNFIGWKEQIYQNLIQVTRNSRAILIIFETIAELNTIKNTLLENNYPSHKILYYSRDDTHEAKNIEKEITNGDVILATNIAGRGTDFKTSKSLEDAGGIEVCLTFLPANKRVEDQAFGRTSRQGNNGTGRLIIEKKDTINKIRVTCDQGLYDIDLVKNFRDAREIERLDDIKTSKLPKIILKDEIFSKYIQKYNNLKNSNKYQDSASNLQLREIHDIWSSAAQEMKQDDEDCYEQLKDLESFAAKHNLDVKDKFLGTNSFYSTILFQLYSNEIKTNLTSSQEIKILVIKHVISNCDMYEYSKFNLHDYVQKYHNPKKWLNYELIQAISRIFEINIILLESTEKIHIFKRALSDKTIYIGRLEDQGYCVITKKQIPNKNSIILDKIINESQQDKYVVKNYVNNEKNQNKLKILTEKFSALDIEEEKKNLEDKNNKYNAIFNKLEKYINKIENSDGYCNSSIYLTKQGNYYKDINYVDESIKCFTKAIEAEKIFNYIAYYNRAIAKIKCERYVSAMDDLLESKKKLEHYIIPQTQSIYILSGLDNKHDNSNLKRQVDSKIAILQNTLENICNVANTIESYNIRCKQFPRKKFKIVFKKKYDILPQGHKDYDSQEVNKIEDMGLSYLYEYEVEEVKRGGIFGAIIAGILGVIQIVVGSVIACIPGVSQVGAHMLIEGCKDLYSAIKGIVKGEFNLGQYLKDKVLSYTVNAIMVGFDTFKKGLEAAKEGLSKVATGIKQLTYKMAGKEVVTNSLSSVGKSEIAKAVQEVTFNQALTVCKETITQEIVTKGALSLGVECVINELVKDHKDIIEEKVRAKVVSTLQKIGLKEDIRKILKADNILGLCKWYNELDHKISFLIDVKDNFFETASKSILQQTLNNYDTNYGTLFKVASTTNDVKTILEYTNKVCANLEPTIKKVVRQIPSYESLCKEKLCEIIKSIPSSSNSDVNTEVNQIITTLINKKIIGESFSVSEEGIKSFSNLDIKYKNHIHNYLITLNAIQETDTKSLENIITVTITTNITECILGLVKGKLVSPAADSIAEKIVKHIESNIAETNKKTQDDISKSLSENFKQSTINSYELYDPDYESKLNSIIVNHFPKESTDGDILFERTNNTKNDQTKNPNSKNNFYENSFEHLKDISDQIGICVIAQNNGLVSDMYGQNCLNKKVVNLEWKVIHGEIKWKPVGVVVHKEYNYTSLNQALNYQLNMPSLYAVNDIIYPTEILNIGSKNNAFVDNYSNRLQELHNSISESNKQTTNSSEDKLNNDVASRSSHSQSMNRMKELCIQNAYSNSFDSTELQSFISSCENMEQYFDINNSENGKMLVTIKSQNNQLIEAGKHFYQQLQDTYKEHYIRKNINDDAFKDHDKAMSKYLTELSIDIKAHQENYNIDQYNKVRVKNGLTVRKNIPWYPLLYANSALKIYTESSGSILRFGLTNILDQTKATIPLITTLIEVTTHNTINWGIKKISPCGKVIYEYSKELIGKDAVDKAYKHSKEFVLENWNSLSPNQKFLAQASIFYSIDKVSGRIIKGINSTRSNKASKTNQIISKDFDTHLKNIQKVKSNKLVAIESKPLKIKTEQLAEYLVENKFIPKNQKSILTEALFQKSANNSKINHKFINVIAKPKTTTKTYHALKKEIIKDFNTQLNNRKIKNIRKSLVKESKPFKATTYQPAEFTVQNKKIVKYSKTHLINRTIPISKKQLAKESKPFKVYKGKKPKIEVKNKKIVKYSKAHLQNRKLSSSKKQLAKEKKPFEAKTDKQIEFEVKNEKILKDYETHINNKQKPNVRKLNAENSEQFNAYIDRLAEFLVKNNFVSKNQKQEFAKMLFQKSGRYSNIEHNIINLIGNPQKTKTYYHAPCCLAIAKQYAKNPNNLVFTDQGIRKIFGDNIYKNIGKNYRADIVVVDLAKNKIHLIEIKSNTDKIKILEDKLEIQYGKIYETTKFKVSTSVLDEDKVIKELKKLQNKIK